MNLFGYRFLAPVLALGLLGGCNIADAMLESVGDVAVAVADIVAPGPAEGRPSRQPVRGASGICNVPGLVAERREPITGPGACGIEAPVAVTRVAGVSLSRPALMNCRTARALDSWVRDGARPAVGRFGGGLRSMKVASHYACRTRNSRRGARLSEHAKGNAIDISAITLQDGRTITVEKGWRGGGSKILRRMHRSACGPFGTVLGPAADRFHRDHLHFDTARYRSGSYCR